MKIEKKTKEMIKFEDVEVGDCFKSDFGVFIKTNEELVNNAVFLDDGGLWDFGAEAEVEVIPVNAKAAFNIAIHDIKQRHDWDINNLILINKDNYESQEPKTGRWIETAEEYYKAVNEYGGGVNENTPYFVDDIACSECLAKYSVIDNETERFDHCPSCGAKMVEPQERSGEE